MITGSIDNSEYENINMAGGIFSAFNAYHILTSGNPCNSNSSYTKKSAQKSVAERLEISISPNPVIHDITLDVIAQTGNYTITIFSSAGHIVNSFQSNFQEGSNQITIPTNLEAGIYFLNLNGNNMSKNTKFVKF